MGSLDRVDAWLRKTTFGARLSDLLARHGLRLEDEIKTVFVQTAKITSEYVMEHGGSVASNLASFILHFGIALLTFFYLLRDGESYYEGVRTLTPMHEQDKAAIFDTLRATLSSVMRGLMLTAVLDGVTIGWAIWFAESLLGFFGDSNCGGGFVALWWHDLGVGAGGDLSRLCFHLGQRDRIGGMVDDCARGDRQLHQTAGDAPWHRTAYARAVLWPAGGIEAYGPIGIFAGPAVIAIFAALLRVYERTYTMTWFNNRLSSRLRPPSRNRR